MNLDKELIKLVTETVRDIAKQKGYATYPKEHEVVMVLTALMIVNKAIGRISDETQ